MTGRVVKTLLSILALAPMVVQANVGKTVYVDLEKVFSSPVISAKADALKAEFDKRYDDFKAAQGRLDEKMAEHEKEVSMMTKIVRENREQELKEMAQRLNQQGAEMSQDYQLRQHGIKTQYLSKIEGIAKKLAAKHNASLVLVKQVVLYADASLDITDELIPELD